MRTPRHKLLQHKPRQHYTPEQIEYIHTAAASGMSVEAMSKTLKTSYLNIISAMKWRRISIRHVRDTHTLTLVQVSEALGIPHSTLRVLVAACGFSNGRKGGTYWFDVDRLTKLLQDQRLWWRWQPQSTAIDWLRELAEEIRNEPVAGQWLPAVDAAAHHNMSHRTIIRYAATGKIPAQRLGKLWLVWCPKE